MSRVVVVTRLESGGFRVADPTSDRRMDILPPDHGVVWVISIQGLRNALTPDVAKAIGAAVLTVLRAEPDTAIHAYLQD